MKTNKNNEVVSKEDELTTLRLKASRGKQKRSIPTDGNLLGVIPRENSRETRYSWTSHRGNHYLRIQDFQFDVRDETWAPVKGKCHTVRIHELPSVLTFIQKAIELAVASVRIQENDISEDLNDPAGGDLNRDYTKNDLMDVQ